MGGIESKERKLKWPRGVKPRTFKTETRIQIAFVYKGVECRELLPPQTITQTAVNAAGGLKNEIARKIAEGKFAYRDYFPNSPKALQFDGSGNRIMLADKLADQLKLYERQHKNGQLSPSTLDGYRKAIKSARMTEFADGKTLTDVTPAALRKFIGEMGVTAKRARNLLTPLRSVFEDALNDELIEFDPFERIALKKLLKQTAKPSEYEVDPFTEAERNAIYKAARADELPMLRFWFNAGLRPGELIGLRWDRIDWIHHRARIDLNVVAKTEKAPKTAAGVRDVDLNQEALDALTAQKAVSFLADGRVWLNPRTGEPWETDAQIRRTLWQPLLKRAGVRHRNPYQARHTYASSRLTAGGNPWYLAEQMGHVDVEMVFRIYGKFIGSDFQRPRLQASAATKPALKVVNGQTSGHDHE